MIDVLDKFKEVYMKDVKELLTKNKVDSEFADEILNDIEENYVRDIAERAIMETIGDDIMSPLIKKVKS